MTASDLVLATRSLEAWATEAEAAAGIARSLVTTAFFPDSLRVRAQNGAIDIDASVAQGAAALLTGQEIGLSPMASFRSIDVIPPGSGSPAIRANAMRALALQHGHDIWLVESTDTRAVVRGLRAGAEHVQESVWTLDRAKKLAVRGFADPKGAWQRQPRNMLVARATAETVRLIAADVLLGLPYAIEELLDEDGDALALAAPEGEPGTTAPLSAAPARRSVRRSRSQPRSRRTTLTALPAGSPTSEGAQSGSEEPPAGPSDDAPRITPAQRARLWAGLRRLGLADKQPALDQLGRWLDPPRELGSTSDLTQAEASAVLGAIDAEETRRAARQAAEDAQAEAERSQEGGDDAEWPSVPAAGQEEPDGGE